MNVEDIAYICHEAVRRHTEVTGGPVELEWKETPWRVKQAAIAGVLWVQENPNAALSAQHETWRQRHIAEGWKYGETVDEENKIHPLMAPYSELPPDRLAKDVLFRAIVLALTNGETHAN